MGGLISTERGIAAGIQAGASLAVAELQRQSEKEKLELQKDVWEQQRKWAAMYHDLWFEHYRPLEIQFLNELKALQPYQPQYDAVRSRAVVEVRREFAAAENKIRRCVDARAVGLRCELRKNLAIEESKAAVAAINRAWRAEEARKDVKDSERDQKILAALQLGRGLGSAALGALGNAANVAANMSGNKYSGYAAAIGNIAATLGNLIMDGGKNQNNNAPQNTYTFDYSMSPNYDFGGRGIRI